MVKFKLLEMKYQSYVGIELENTSSELEQLKRDGYFVKEKLLSDDLCLEISNELDKLWQVCFPPNKSPKSIASLSLAMV